jgi:hypothetical protein
VGRGRPGKCEEKVENTMTDTSHGIGDRAQPAGYAASTAPEVTRWTGWIVFAGIMIILLGAFQAIEGFVAIFDPGYYLVRPNGLVISVDYTAWGWVHLILGLAAVATGLGLMAGNTLARVIGVVIAVVSAILNLAFLAAYPVWSTIVITLDVVVIYAIVVHGRELKA